MLNLQVELFMRKCKQEFELSWADLKDDYFLLMKNLGDLELQEWRHTDQDKAKVIRMERKKAALERLIKQKRGITLISKINVSKIANFCSLRISMKMKIFWGIVLYHS